MGNPALIPLSGVGSFYRFRLGFKICLLEGEKRWLHRYLRNSLKLYG